MRLKRLPALAALAAAACGQPTPPSFRAADVRPHGAARPYPLVPGQLSWIFGRNLGRGCSARNLMDPATYQTELCGTRVLVGGIAARLIFVSEGQINLVVPREPWEDRMVEIQVIRDGVASAPVPVRFGFDRPLLSLAAPARLGMPVWLRVEKPWGKGWLRYPFHTEPWDLGPGSFEVRFQGRALAPGPGPYTGAWFVGGGMIGLPSEVPEQYLHRVPLHLAYCFDRPGTYEVRYTEYRFRPGTPSREVYQQSRWTPIEVLPSTAAERHAWLRALSNRRATDVVELLTDYLPGLLAARGEPALRLLARYLDHPDPLVRQYAGYGLHYFDPALRRRVVPGRTPPPGGVVR